MKESTDILRIENLQTEFKVGKRIVHAVNGVSSIKMSDRIIRELMGLG